MVHSVHTATAMQRQTYANCHQHIVLALQRRTLHERATIKLLCGKN